MEKLYHLVHGEFEGEQLNPTQANDRDANPYVYATSQLNEALPYASPNGTRIFCHTIPETNMTFAVIPNREEFLKNSKVQGVVYELPMESFVKSPHHETQYISKQPITKSEMKEVARLNSIEDVMKAGLHVLFTDEPHTAENHGFYEDIMNDPDFPNNMKYYVDTGVFSYENETAGINASPFLSSSVDLEKTSELQIKPAEIAKTPANVAPRKTSDGLRR